MADALDDIITGAIDREGGYVNHPDDRGGPTCWGITEVVARANGYGGDMAALPRSLAQRIYRQKYIERPGFDVVAGLSMRVAEEIVDTGINMGPGVAAKFLQRALNAFNDRGKFYADLVVDGEAGPATVGALRAFLRLRGAAGEEVLLRALNCLQGTRYIELCEGRAANEAFAFGWFNGRIGSLA